MIDFSHTSIDEVSIHLVGNQDNAILELSEEPAQLNGDIKDLLKQYFLKPFKSGQYFNFDRDKGDRIYEHVKSIFSSERSLHDNSVNLAERLFQVSERPNIKTGEFFVVHFWDCQLEDELVDAIGLFKSESKETFLKIYPENSNFRVDGDQGINISKLDKGVMIFNIEEEDGYLVQVIDQTNVDNASYWKDDFLTLKARSDEFNQTHGYIQMCRDFAMEELPTENQGEKIGMVNETVNYFKSNDHFDKEDFEQQVIRQPEIIEAFEDYSNTHELTDQMKTVNEFDISSQAVRYSKRFIKSVIKLDKNFHIYVHGNRERITKGFDEEKGLNYYQVYFDEETG